MDRYLEYYRNGWLKSIWNHGNPGGEAFLYECGAAGNIVRAKEGGSWNEYEYDAENQLVLWRDADGVEHTYAYDPAGDLTEKDGLTFTYDAANQITSAGFTFDTNGNLTSDGTLN